jgi:signal transduction histidine kinase
VTIGCWRARRVTPHVFGVSTILAYNFYLNIGAARAFRKLSLAAARVAVVTPSSVPVFSSSSGGLPESRYRALFDAIDEGFCVVRVILDSRGSPRDYEFLEVNAAFERQTGLAHAQGRRMREIAPTLEPYWHEIYGNVALTGEPVRFESYAAALDRWFDVFAFRVDAPEERHVAILFSDVTERHRAWRERQAVGEALSASEARLRCLIDNSTGFIALLDAEGTLLEVGAPGLRVSGLSREQVLGKKFWECDWWADDEQRAHAREWFFEPSGLDITAGKRMAQPLTEADRRKDEFLTTLAHELRNPLAPISNGLHLLRRQVGAQVDLVGVIDMMDRQVARVVRLVDDLLDVGRIARGKVALRRQPVDLIPLLRSTLESVQPVIDSRQHSLQISMVPGPVIVQGDPDRLMQVLSNLILNAAKFTPPRGTVAVELSTAPRWAVVTVRDTGIGIAPEKIHSVFDLFSQAHGTAGNDGLGIGLALVRGLVQRHGGTVIAESDGEGRGSRFTVRLPLIRPTRIEDVGNVAC